MAPICLDDFSSRSRKDEDCSDSRKLPFGDTDECYQEPAGCDDTSADPSEHCGLECECNCNVRLDAGNGLGFFVSSQVEASAEQETACGTAPTGPTVCTTYELGLGFKVDVGGGDTLHFVGSMSYSIPNTLPQIGVSLSMVGVWEGAFGIDKLHLADAMFAFSVVLPVTMPPALGAITVGATVFMGTHDCTNCDEVDNCVITSTTDETTGVVNYHKPAGTCKELGAYVSIDIGAAGMVPKFGLIYGTETPSLLDLMGLFVSTSTTDMLSEIPVIGEIFGLTLGPYYAGIDTECSDRDMATIADGCGGCSDADGNAQCDSLDEGACYELFQECYFVAWFAPDGVAEVQTALKAYEGPSKILAVLPSQSCYGFSGSVSLGGVSAGVSLSVGFSIPILGASYMSFSAYLTIFNFFKGTISFSYDYGIDNPLSIAQSIVAAIATGDESAVQGIINSIVPNPSFSIAASVELDMTVLKQKVLSAITKAMNVSDDTHFASLVGDLQHRIIR